MSQVSTSIQVNDHGAIDRLASFPALKEQAMRRAVNRTGEWVRTRTLDAIVAQVAIKKSDLNGAHRFGGVVLKKAGGGGGESSAAVVTVSGNRIPLFMFKGKPTEPVGGMGKGVSYQILAAGGRKKISDNAFIARMKSGHTGFFRRGGSGPRVRIVAKSGLRKGKMISSELGIEELYGPSIPHVADQSPEFNKMLQVDAGERLEMQVGREVNYILTGTSKGAEG